MTLSKIADQIDMFYEDSGNRRIPLIEAYYFILKRIKGSTRQELKWGVNDIQHRQRHRRNPYEETLEITIPSHPQEGTLLAISSNISDAGICIYTFKPLEVGQDIVFKNTLPVPHRKATVRWVKQCNWSICKAGVLFSA